MYEYRPGKDLIVKVLEELIILLGLYNQRNLLYAMAFDLGIKAI
jgi:hypothetical protein